MHRNMVFWICVSSLILGLALAPSFLSAQEKSSAGATIGSVAGSLVLSLFYFPIRMVTCVGTQTVTAPAYLITGDVPGNFKGGTNRKEISEVSKKACTSSWVITPKDLRRDYRD